MTDRPKDQTPTSEIASLAKNRPGLAVAMVVLQGFFGLLNRLTSSAVLIAGILAVALVAVAMMLLVPANQYGSASTSFVRMVEAIGKAASNEVFCLGGYILLAVGGLLGGSVIWVQRARRREQDHELRDLRAAHDSSRPSSQMSLEELFERQEKSQ